MRQTVVAMFDRYAEAKRAALQLRESGFGDSVYLTDEVGAAESMDDGAKTERDTGVFAQVRQFFSGIFGGDDDDREASPYAEALRRGGAIVKVEVDADADVERARQALEAAGAVDIDERASEWRASGWNEGTGLTSEEPSLRDDERRAMPPSSASSELPQSGSASAMQMTETAGTQQRRAARTGESSDDQAASSTLARTSASEDGEVIPVVQEDLQVGKRAVRKGGVRVFARTVETPVQESVALRSEHAEVERRAVDRPATSADLEGVGERTIEVRETAEIPVVAKQARVVEEVSVGKRSEERTENIEDTVRRTEVNVEKLADDDGVATSGATPYRSHFDAHYGSSGGRWDEYEPAYHYGEAARSRYQGRQWDDIEPELRGDWESSEPGTWEKFKAAIRHAWERATS